MDAPDRHLGFLLSDTARLLRRRFDARARALGLTRAQWQVLAYLARNEGIHQGALADILELEPITLVRILDRLQASGMVERRHHPADRRVRLLYLTEQARPLLSELRRLGAITIDEAFEGVPQTAREGLVDLLTTVRGNLSRAPATDDDVSLRHAQG